MATNEPKLNVHIFRAEAAVSLELAMIPTAISAGFPSPAMDFISQSIDLNKHLVRHPHSTFYGRVSGQSMKNAGIDDGDILVIDKSIEPRHGSIAVCVVDGEFTLKRIHISKGQCWLMPENESYPPIEINNEIGLMIWGVVTFVVKAV